MKIDSVQNNRPNFTAQLRLKGNVRLISKEATNTLNNIVSKIGSASDIIEIAIPVPIKYVENKANIDIVAHINGAKEQISQVIEKGIILSGITIGLEKIKEKFSNSDKENIEIVEASNLETNIAKNGTINDAVSNKKNTEKINNNIIDMEDPETQNLLSELTTFLREQKTVDYCPDYTKDFLKIGKAINDPISAPIVTEDGKTDIDFRAITYVVNFGKDKLLKLLLKHPDIDVNVRDFYNRTPLNRASAAGHVECLKLLLERKDVDETIKDKKGLTAEEAAAREARDFYKMYKKKKYKKFW